MKKLLLVTLLSGFSSLQAQILSLSKAAFEPAINDTSRFYALDTAFYTGGLNLTNTGANAVWNYSNLNAFGNLITTAYLPASEFTNAPSGCNLVGKQGALNNFYKSVSTPSDQLEFMGIKSSSLSLNFTNTAIAAKYPFTFGNTYADSYSGSFTFSISGTASGSSSVTADGHGTLMLPNGVTLTNVLRIKTVQTTVLNAIFITGNIKQTTYDFYHNSQKFPILTIDYQSSTITGQTPTVSAQVLGNNSNFVVGLKENEMDLFKFSIYPNPGHNMVYFELDYGITAEKISVYNQLGQLQINQAYEKELNIETLPNGIYYLELKTNKGIARRKIIKQ